MKHCTKLWKESLIQYYKGTHTFKLYIFVSSFIFSFVPSALNVHKGNTNGPMMHCLSHPGVFPIQATGLTTELLKYI